MTEPLHRFELTVRAKPHGQGRARSGNGRMYTPTETRKQAEIIVAQWTAAGCPTLIDGWYRAILSSYRQRPDGHYRSDGKTLNAQGERRVYPDKPDLDNEVKMILDTLQAVGAIPDDRKLVDLLARKLWLADPAQKPYLFLTFMGAA